MLFDRLSLELEPGQMLFVTGPNGSGKSTLLRLLGGLLAPASGTIAWQDRPIDELGGSYRQNYLLLGQSAGMKPELTVHENISYAYSLLGHRPPNASSACWQRLGLANLGRSLWSVLSSGERARAELCPLVDIPRKLWLLDEPTTSLDHDACRLVEQMMCDHAESGGMIVCATHLFFKPASSRTRYLQLSIETS